MKYYKKESEHRNTLKMPLKVELLEAFSLEINRLYL